MGHYLGWVGAGGSEWGWVHCLIMLPCNSFCESARHSRFMKFFGTLFYKAPSGNCFILSNVDNKTPEVNNLFIKAKVLCKEVEPPRFM